MPRISLIITLLLGCSGAALATQETVPDERAVIEFDSAIGTVTFNHRKHAELSFTQCTTCHHKWTSGEAIKPCHACHAHEPEGDDEVRAKTAFHTRCIGCHEYTVGKGEVAGPVKKKCTLCHIE